jgi:K+ transporter
MVLPITIVILIGLFAIQARGTASVGKLFGPVMLVYFAVLAVLGVVGIARASGDIVGAQSLVRAALLLMTRSLPSWRWDRWCSR